MSDHYETLGVRRNASSEEIKTAYRRLVRNYYPDKLPPGTPEMVKRDAAEKFLVIQNAFDVLSTRERFHYDRNLNVEEVPWPSSPAIPSPTPSEDIYCRECGTQLNGGVCARCTKRQSSVLYRAQRGLSSYEISRTAHPSVVFLWVVFFTAGLGVAIVTPQSGFYVQGKPWDAAACSEFLTFFTIGLVIVIFKNGIGGLWRGIERLCTSRPFTGTLADSGHSSRRVISCRRDSVITEGYNVPARFACVRVESSRSAVRTSCGTAVRDYQTRTHADVGAVHGRRCKYNIQSGGFCRTGTPADEWRAHWLFRGFPAPVRQWASDRLSSRHGICICCAESQLRHHVHRKRKAT